MRINATVGHYLKYLIKCERLEIEFEKDKIRFRKYQNNFGGSTVAYK